MNKKLIRRILAVAVIATFLIGTMSFAQEYNAEIPKEEMQVINADDIGVKTMDHFTDITEKVEDVNEDVDIETENTVVDEVPVYVEDLENEIPVRTKPAETEKEDTLPEEAEPVEEEDLSEPPEGMFEGYISGEYLPVNYYECELHDGCHMCENHNYKISYSSSESNGEFKYYHEKVCVICGHGKNEEITESEYNDYFENK